MKSQPARFNAYMVTLHPRHYGKSYTEKQLQKFAAEISDRIQRQFPGVVVQINEDFGNPEATRGPNPKIVREIDQATIAALHEVVPIPSPTRAQAKRSRPAR
jgi:hypothetical protein